jgi:hypothetical protein
MTLTDKLRQLEQDWRDSQTPAYLAEYDRDSATIIRNGRKYLDRPVIVATDRETELAQRPAGFAYPPSTEPSAAEVVAEEAEVLRAEYLALEHEPYAKPIVRHFDTATIKSRRRHVARISRELSARPVSRRFI